MTLWFQNSVRSFKSPRTRKGFLFGGYIRGRYRRIFPLTIVAILIYGVIGTVNRFFPRHLEREDSPSSRPSEVRDIRNCDIFDGRWIYDASYPLYNASTCPFAEKGFRCQENGRVDADYMKWKWHPYHCEIPRFNASGFLKKLHGFRIIFIGDSMARTQWESLICLLMQGVHDPNNTVYEVNGSQITKRIPYLGVRFSSFDLDIEYYRSPFLVKKGYPPKHVPKRVHWTLKLDKPDFVHKKLLNADVLIVNTGHWWTPTKTYQVGCYFQVGDSLKLGLKMVEAYQRALSTWASWIEDKINTNRTRVYFRSFEPAHWEGSFTKGECKVTQQPMNEPGEVGNNTFSLVLSDIVSQMTVPVRILNVTTLSAYRNDAHVGNWSGASTVPDCSHWCLPGVPDTWNELLLASLTM